MFNGETTSFFVLVDYTCWSLNLIYWSIFRREIFPAHNKKSKTFTIEILPIISVSYFCVCVLFLLLFFSCDLIYKSNLKLLDIFERREIKLSRVVLGRLFCLGVRKVFFFTKSLLTSFLILLFVVKYNFKLKTAYLVTVYFFFIWLKINEKMKQINLKIVIFSIWIN